MTPLHLLSAPALLAAAVAATASPAAIRVRDAQVAAPPPGAPAASAHLVIVDGARADDRLLGVESPDAARVEVHAMDMTGGVMRMRPVSGPLRIPAGGVLDLSAASGRHLMLVAPKRSLRPGDHVRLVLRFASAGSQTVEAPVVGRRP